MARWTLIVELDAPDHDTAMHLARSICGLHGVRLQHLVSTASRELAREEEQTNRRNRGLKFRSTEEPE